MPPQTKKTRALLKSAFGEDAVPMPDDFGALIDAGINQTDDGIDITDNIITISKATTASQGFTVTGEALTIGQENATPAANLALKVYAPFTAGGAVTLKAGVTATRKIIAAGGLDVTGTGLNIGTGSAGLATTIYNSLTIAATTAGTVTTPGKLYVDSIAATTTNTDLILSGQGTTGAVNVVGKLLVDSIAPNTTTANADLTLAAGTNGKIKLASDLLADSITANSTNGDLKLAGDGIGNVTVTTPLVVGASDAAVLSKMFGALTIAQSSASGSTTVTYGSLNVDSISPSIDTANADLTLAGKGTGKVKITSTLAVDKIVPNSSGTNANLTLAGNTAGSVLVTRPLTVGAANNAVTATIFNSLTITAGSASNQPSKLLVDNISPSTTGNTALSLGGNGTGGVTANRLQVIGPLWVGSTAAKQSVTVNGSLYTDTLSSVTDNANLTIVPKGTGIVDVQKTLTISNGNLNVSAGDLTIGTSGGTARTLTVNGNLVVIGSVAGAAWNFATLASGNSHNTTSGYGRMSYSKDSSNFVRLRGSVSVSSSSTYDGMYLITTLPEGYRPAFTTWFPVSYGGNTSHNSAYLRISSGGQVCATTTGSYFDLDGITFRAELPTPWLELNLNGNATDTSVNNRSGTATSITWPQDSQFSRQVASFASSTSNIKYPSLTCPKEFTFSLWVKRDANNAGWTDLIEFGTQDDPAFYLYNNAVAMTDCNLSYGPVLDSTRWYHLAVAGKTSGAQMYVDGVLVQSSTSIESFSGVGLTLGYNNNDSIFKGLMSKVAIYNQALTAEQIEELYKS